MKRLSALPKTRDRLLFRVEVRPSIASRSQGRVSAGGAIFRCALGPAGIVSTKREGDGATPRGVFLLRRLWIRADRRARPPTGLPARVTRRDDGWCDAPGHRLYNRLVRLPFPASHETMWRDDGLYDLVVEIGFNDRNPRPGKGSAIFLHAARPGFSPTAGCVALAPAVAAPADRSDWARDAARDRGFAAQASGAGLTLAAAGARSDEIVRSRDPLANLCADGQFPYHSRPKERRGSGDPIGPCSEGTRTMSDFNRNAWGQTTLGQTTTQGAVVDEGLRAYMLRVYNYMSLGLAITGVAAIGAYMLAVTTDPSVAAGKVGNMMLTSFGVALFTSALKWVVMLAPLGMVFFLSRGCTTMSATGRADRLLALRGADGPVAVVDLPGLYRAARSRRCSSSRPPPSARSVALRLHDEARPDRDGLVPDDGPVRHHHRDAGEHLPAVLDGAVRRLGDRRADLRGPHRLRHAAHQGDVLRDGRRRAR